MKGDINFESIANGVRAYGTDPDVSMDDIADAMFEGFLRREEKLRAEGQSLWDKPEGVKMVEHVDSASDERTVNNTMRHQYRVLTDAEKDTMVLIKDLGLGFITTIESAVPKGREASLAKTKIEEAVMWAVKGLTG